MTKLIAVVALSLFCAGVAAASMKTQKVTDAQVEAAIDARLHQMIKQLNERHAVTARR